MNVNDKVRNVVLIEHCDFKENVVTRIENWPAAMVIHVENDRRLNG